MWKNRVILSQNRYASGLGAEWENAASLALQCGMAVISQSAVHEYAEGREELGNACCGPLSGSWDEIEAVRLTLVIKTLRKFPVSSDRA